MSKNLVSDPMPVFYEANTSKKITELLDETGLEMVGLKLNGDPTYVAINKLFFYLGVILEYLTPNSLRVHIIGHIRKKG